MTQSPDVVSSQGAETRWFLLPVLLKMAEIKVRRLISQIDCD